MSKTAKDVAGAVLDSGYIGQGPKVDEFEEKLKDRFKEIEKNINQENIKSAFVVEMKLLHAKKLFVALNELLHRNDYLKSSVFGDDEEDKD